MDQTGKMYLKELVLHHLMIGNEIQLLLLVEDEVLHFSVQWYRNMQLENV